MFMAALLMVAKKSVCVYVCWGRAEGLNIYSRMNKLQFISISEYNAAKKLQLHACMNTADQKTKLKKSKKITFSRIPRLKHPYEIHT